MTFSIDSNYNKNNINFQENIYIIYIIYIIFQVIERTFELLTFFKVRKIRVKFDQDFGKLQAKVVDAKRDQERILKRRTPMKKRYYSPILEMLKIKKYKDVAEKYLELAYTLTKRKDLETSSLMVILHGLALLKTGESLKIIKNNINNFLNSLGVNKKLVEETYYIMLILFLIEVKIYNFDKYLHKIKEMLEILPLFEEERVLIEIEE